MSSYHICPKNRKYKKKKEKKGKDEKKKKIRQKGWLHPLANLTTTLARGALRPQTVEVACAATPQL